MIDLRNQRTRLIVAFALAIALHEIALGFIHFPRSEPTSEQPVKAPLVVIRIPPPTPAPKPTPRPTPRPTPVPPTPPPEVTVPPHVTPAPVRQLAGRASGHPARHRGGGAHAAVAKAVTGTYANPNAAGAGTGTSTGQGSGNAPGAGGGNGGNGSGQGGNGNGAVNADTPCGAVILEPNGEPRIDHGTAYEPIEAKVSFRDGHTETAMFPYKWVYPNAEQTDPWSDTNLKRSDVYLIPLQTPPPGTDPSTLPPLIQYILKHTRTDGMTDLPDCPSPAPHP
ncbi:MAG TPA: hypothetical protein VFB22_05995 [Candidatus Baltobacteraceae bacterium]|nr:hypothetical protein [Candidatus Baltobacteraceae bacterium]